MRWSVYRAMPSHVRIPLLQVNVQCIGDNVDAITNHEVLLPGQMYGMLLKVCHV